MTRSTPLAVRTSALAHWAGLPFVMALVLVPAIVLSDASELGFDVSSSIVAVVLGAPVLFVLLHTMWSTRKVLRVEDGMVVVRRGWGRGRAEAMVDVDQIDQVYAEEMALGADEYGRRVGGGLLEGRQLGLQVIDTAGYTTVLLEGLSTRSRDRAVAWLEAARR